MMPDKVKMENKASRIVHEKQMIHIDLDFTPALQELLEIQITRSSAEYHHLFDQAVFTRIRGALTLQGFMRRDGKDYERTRHSQ